MLDLRHNLLESTMRVLLRYRRGLLIFAFILCQCTGVEVGNPHPDGDESESPKLQASELTVQLSGSQAQEARNLLLNINRVIVKDEFGDHLSLPMVDEPPMTVDLIRSAGKERITLVDKVLVPTGHYETFIIEFASDQFGAVIDQNGTSFGLTLPDPSDRFVRVSEAFKLTDEDGFGVTLKLDVGRSLQLMQPSVPKPGGAASSPSTPEQPESQPGAMVYTFEPVITPVPESLATGIKGQLSDKMEQAFICAYLYGDDTEQQATLSLIDHRRRRRDERRYKDIVEPPPFEELYEAKPAPRYESSDTLIKDGDESCKNASALVPVVEGIFNFEDLLPGQYDLRLFIPGGGYRDIATGVLATPNSITDLGVLSID